MRRGTPPTPTHHHQGRRDRFMPKTAIKKLTIALPLGQTRGRNSPLSARDPCEHSGGGPLPATQRQSVFCLITCCVMTIPENAELGCAICSPPHQHPICALQMHRQRALDTSSSGILCKASQRSDWLSLSLRSGIVVILASQTRKSNQGNAGVHMNLQAGTAHSLLGASCLSSWPAFNIQLPS